MRRASAPPWGLHSGTVSTQAATLAPALQLVCLCHILWVAGFGSAQAAERIDDGHGCEARPHDNLDAAVGGSSLVQRVDLRWKRGMRTADSSAAFAEDESFKEDQAEEQGGEEDRRQEEEEEEEEDEEEDQSHEEGEPTAKAGPQGAYEEDMKNESTTSDGPTSSPNSSESGEALSNTSFTKTTTIESGQEVMLTTPFEDINTNVSLPYLSEHGCHCRSTWTIENTTYHGCSVLNFAGTRMQGCIVEESSEACPLAEPFTSSELLLDSCGILDDGQHEETVARLAKALDEKCHCQPRWEHNGSTFSGCATTPDHDRAWCFIVEDETLCPEVDGIGVGYQRWRHCEDESWRTKVLIPVVIPYDRTPSVFGMPWIQTCLALTILGFICGGCGFCCYVMVLIPPDLRDPASDPAGFPSSYPPTTS